MLVYLKCHCNLICIGALATATASSDVLATATATASSDVVNTTNAPLEPYSFVGDDQKMQVGSIFYVIKSV